MAPLPFFVTFIFKACGNLIKKLPAVECDEVVTDNKHFCHQVELKPHLLDKHRDKVIQDNNNNNTRNLYKTQNSGSLLFTSPDLH